MGMLVDGKWTHQRPDVVGGRFVRPESQFRNFITADGSSGFKAEPGRYHLYMAYNCPWAHRTLIFRKLKGLEGMISISSARPDDRREGWRFHEGFPGAGRDEVNGCEWLHQVYSLAKPDYTGTCTVPTLWDRKTRTIVNNQSSAIIRMFNSAFDGVGAKPGDYCPAPLRGEIDLVNEFVYAHLNNGVYRTGFARSEEHTSELQSPCNLVCRLLLEKKKKNIDTNVVTPDTHVEIRAPQSSTTKLRSHTLLTDVQDRSSDRTTDKHNESYMNQLHRSS